MSRQASTPSLCGMILHNDVSPLEVNFRNATYDVDGGERVTAAVGLTTAPGSEVVIPISASSQGSTKSPGEPRHPG